MREIKKLIIHCSDSDDSLDIDANTIRLWHLERGWSDIGYHYVIKRDGTVQLGRPESVVGAHVKGENHDSIGICLVGRKDFDERQFKSLFAICKGICFKYSLDITEDIYGHYEFDKHKTCPNLDMIKFRAEMVFK